MRSLLAAFLLCFQLQPVLGTAFCLDLLRKPVQEDCQMPENGSLPSHSLSAAVPMASPSCSMATICAPASLAVPALIGESVRVIPLEAAPMIGDKTSPTEIASAPPLPPPRV